MKNWKKFFGMLGALICALGLNAMEFKSNPNVIAELEYFYAKDGTITGRRVNDSIQMYSYDKRGQLLAVIDGDGKPVEQYVYDPAGNILSKTVNGKTTIFTYDKANQLVSSTVDGKTTDYRYDGAGRLVQEGDKTYQYGYLDKILNVLENGETIAGFDYHMDGQIASSTTKDGTENFLWDGLALIHRDGTNYVNEPAVTGGNPILADGKVLFNDMLGTTLGVKSGDQFNRIAMTAFGESGDQSAFFTGKPAVDELGYAFLFRNYRADQGKWQTQDPLGYPDGWNNFVYVNNGATSNIDLLGGWTYNFSGDWTDAERTLFGQTMNQALIAIGRALNDLHNVINNHGSCGISSCACPLHSETSGLNNLRGILANTVSKLQGTDGLTVKKSDSMGNIAGTYNPGLFGNETMTVNSATGSAYNFFTSLPGTALTVAIHESSHAGGSNDYLNEHGSPDHKWDNAHTIENISNNGIKSILQAMGMPQNCLCE